MNSGKVIIASNRKRNAYLARTIAEKTGRDVVLISEKSQMTDEYLKAISPEWVFVPHWSYIIPKAVYMGL